MEIGVTAVFPQIIGGLLYDGDLARYRRKIEMPRQGDQDFERTV
jgi:hypothetical protein